MEKICTICNQEKDISCFSKKYKTKDGIQKYSSICKNCFNIKDTERRKTKEYREKKTSYDSLYYKQNQEKILERKKEYHIENKKDILKKKQIYRDKPENKKRTKEYNKYYRTEQKENFYKYRNNNPHIIVWRSMLYRTLKHLRKQKEGDTQTELGYSAYDLKSYLENIFKEGMSWENYGEWEIDHIIPLTLFDKNATCCEVNALSNLQPLWKEDNIHKYNNII
jgi:hypothetical protein